MGTYDWKAFAYVDYYISVFNSPWDKYPSIHLHELGHCLGLSHSHDNVAYGDESCLMGTSSFKEDGPKKCFNGPKSWQLGWYNNEQKDINAKQIMSLVALQED